MERKDRKSSFFRRNARRRPGGHGEVSQVAVAIIFRQKETAYELYLGEKSWRDLKKIIKQKQNEFIVVQRESRMFMDQIARKFLINDLVYEGHTPLIIMP